MSQPPPMPRDQSKIDREHLKLLSIFHFVAAGLGIFGVLFVCGHFLFFRAFFANPEMWADQKSGPPPEAFMAMFQWFYFVMGGWFVVGMVLNVISGIALRRRRWRVFSLVVAVLNCLRMPLGTILGAFTLVVLLRESVAQLYEMNRASFRQDTAR